jgi:hypothetical protein
MISGLVTADLPGMTGTATGTETRGESPHARIGLRIRV